MALASNGSTAVASSSYPNGGYPPSSANDGDHIGLNWGNHGGWNDGTRDVYPDALEIDFSGNQTISEIRMFTLQDDFKNPQEPTANMTANVYGITDFDVQTWNGTIWVTVPGGSVAGNDRVMRVFDFQAVTTSKIRVLVNAARSHFSRIIELEAYNCPP